MPDRNDRTASLAVDPQVDTMALLVVSHILLGQDKYRKSTDSRPAAELAHNLWPMERKPGHLLRMVLSL